MSTITYDIGASCTATSFTSSATPGFSGNGSGLTNLPSASINMGATTGNAVYSNGPSGLATEAFLATSRGGLGVNVASLTGALIDTAGVITAQVVASANTASAIVARDAGGKSSFSEVISPLATLTVTTGSTTVYPDLVSNQTTGAAVAKSHRLLASLVTANAVSTIIASIPVPASSVTFLKVSAAFGIAGAVSAGMNSFLSRLKVATNVGESPTYQNKSKNLDAAFATTDVTLAYNSGTGKIDVSVLGVAATTINWSCDVESVTITC